MSISPIRLLAHGLLVFSLLLMLPFAAQASREVTLAWDPNSESTLDGYRVFCWLVDEPNQRLMLWEGKDTTCTMVGFDEQSEYAFIVRAFDIYNNESPDSNTVYLSAETDPGEDPPPSDPPPSDPPPSDPPPSDPPPSDPPPSDPPPSDPPPSDPPPSDPPPSDPPPSDPPPSDPPPSDPPPSDPPPSDPPPSDPPPSDPPPSDPPPSEDPDVRTTPTYPCSPDLISPHHGAVDQSLTPDLEVAGCGIYQIFARHDRTQWQVNRDSDNALIVDEVNSNNLEALTIPAGLLEDNTAYSWRVRFLYASGAQSQWSALGRFTTLSVFNGPDQPIGLSPADGESDQFLTPVLRSSAFSTNAVHVSHTRSQWRMVRDSDGTDVYAISSTLYLESLDIPPLILEEDTAYQWMVRYYGSDGTVSEWSLPVRFSTGMSALDSNRNGLPDGQEVTSDIDLDSNGTADIDQADLRSINLLGHDGQMAVQALPDRGIASIAALESTDLTSIGAVDAFPYELPLGLVSYRLVLDHVGGLTKIRVHLSAPAPPAAKWVKYDLANGWQDYSAHAVFAEDRLSVEIEMRDGGIGDADGVANGVIVDPSGVGLELSGDDSPSLTTADSDSSGGGGCFISGLQD